MAAGAVVADACVAPAVPVHDLLQPRPHPERIDGSILLVGQQEGDGVVVLGAECGLPVGWHPALDHPGPLPRPLSVHVRVVAKGRGQLPGEYTVQ